MSRFYLTLIAFFLFNYTAAFADDFEWGKHTGAELTMSRYVKDTNAHALILNEYGHSYVSTNDGYHLIYERHVRLKLFDEKAFNYGNIIISLYKQDNMRYQDARDIKAITTYVDDNGIIHTDSLQSSKIFHVELDKHHEQMKFTLPNLHKGCIIEYRYTIEKPNIFDFPDWDFQGFIPKLSSEYKVSIPAIMNYNIALHGSLKLTNKAAEIWHDCFTSNGIKCDCSNLTYSMTDIPAFEEEEYMTAPKNFMSYISFELSDYVNAQGARIKVSKEWNDVDHELKSSEYFGGQIKRSSLMKERIKDVVAGKADPLEKAKAIYAFIQKNIRCNNYYTKYSADGIKQALDTHKGTTGDINLTLIAALKAADINTEAVILSTRQHGMVNKLYPTIDDFDYVIAKVNIGEKSYLLDASDPNLGFGMVPMHCINDQARVISFEKPSYWMDITEPQKKSELMSFDLTLQTDGKLKGTFTHYESGYDAYLRRTAIKKFNSVDEYVENRDERLRKIKILKSEIQNLDSLDMPIVEKYEIEISAFKDLDHNKLNFNPVILDRRVINPFRLADRTYPVDMGIPWDQRMLVTIHLPAGFKIESAPRDTLFTLPNNGGRLITTSTIGEDACTYSQMLQFNKPVYSVEEYPYIKEFYNKIIQVDAADIVLSKK